MSEQSKDGWQDIASAPKGDGIFKYVTVRLWDGGRERHGRWDADTYARKPRPYWSYEGSFGKAWDRDHQPTHWMLMAAPPHSSCKG